MKVTLKPWEEPLGSPWHAKRDFTKDPYSRPEERIAEYLADLSLGLLGGGDDPVGFLIASHANLRHELLRVSKELDLLKPKDSANDAA